MKYVAFDTETTGMKKYEGDQIFAYSLTDWNGETAVHRIPWTPGSLDFRRHDNYLRLQDFWHDTSIAKIMHNAKFDLAFCRANGIIIPSNTEFHDTMIMSQMLQNLAASHALDALAEMIFKYRAPADDEVAKEASKHRRKYLKEHPNARIGLSFYQFVNEQLMTRYQIADGDRTQLLYQCFAPKLHRDPRMWADYLNELDLIISTIHEEEHGILIDVRQSKKLVDFLSSELKIIQKESKELIGKDVNFNSSKQVVDMLTELGVKLEKTNAKGDSFSAAKDVLIDIRDEHPIVNKILKFRAYDKGITMIESYLDLMNPADNLVHANIKTNHAVTGRQSCSEPNLQNVTKELSINTVYGIPARRCFRAEPEHVIFLVDYAGIELRLIVSESGEEEFIEAMKRGDDVHGMAASCLYGDNWNEALYMIDNPTSKKPEWMKPLVTEIIAKDVAKGNQPRHHEDVSIFKQIKKNMRDGAKNFEFGIAYGGGYAAITHSLVGLVENQKRTGHSAFCKRWPKIAYFTPNIIKMVQAQGFLTTSYGRKLYVKRSQAYTGSNYIIQGSAAGILKRGQNRIDEYCRFEHDNRIRQMVPIHDELIIKYPRDLLAQRDYILSDIAHLMTFQPEIKVPLEVEWKMTTTNWAAAKPFHLDRPSDWEFAPHVQLTKVAQHG